MRARKYAHVWRLIFHLREKVTDISLDALLQQGARGITFNKIYKARTGLLPDMEVRSALTDLADKDAAIYRVLGSKNGDLEFFSLQ